MEQEMARVLQDVAWWDTCSLADCEALARALERRLPSAFEFVRVETYQVGAQRHTGALFAWSDGSASSQSLFVLMPGGTMTLGYDRSQRLTPREKLVRAWWDYQQELVHGESVTLDGELVREIVPMPEDAFSTFVASHLLPERTVTLLPFLVEVEAHVASEVLPPPFRIYERFSGARGSRRYTFTSWMLCIPQRDVVAFLKQQGCRLASVDEWEYVCGAGTRTLFYWGNSGLLAEEDPVMSPPARNAFGVKIANTALEWEYCNDPTMMRGGDGGAMVYGYGADALSALLPYASAYHYRLNDLQMAHGVERPYFRRVFDLSFLFEEMK